jgi:hypothetical protein
MVVPMLGSYPSSVDKAVGLTPESRNRVVDTWRVIALLVVVFGHWLAASIWVEPDGTLTVMNTLEWIPYSGWFTWVVQVMPVFFFVGGYANARALENKATNRRNWITIRFRRLYSPAVPVIVVWTLLAIVLRNFIDDDLVYAGVLNATLPLWFLAVYLLLVAIAPLTYQWWQRWDLWTVGVFAAAALVVDVAYIRFNVPGVGWVNLLFVWATVHQLGYWWETRERSESVISAGRALGLSAIGLAALVAVTALDWYPVAMITIPGAGANNVTPPTSAMTLLALIQIGVILATAGVVGRFAQTRRNWRVVVGVSGFIMTIYVWHLTALSLLLAVGIFAFDGIAFSIQPGTAAWWLTRPVFYAVLIVVTSVIVISFAIFERDIDTTQHSRSMWMVTAGMTATIAALASTAFIHLVEKDASINWWIPILTVVAALAMSAYPASWKRSAS